jgi:hypothetical protein
MAMSPGGCRSRNETKLTSLDVELTHFEPGALSKKESNNQDNHCAIVEPLRNEVGGN